MYDVSVIVPIYNMEAHVAEGVAMLRAQTCQGMEVILVNDGSTDGSEAAVQKAIEGLDNYTLITTPNQGSGLARNTGIERASGKYLYFFDIDDHIVPNAIERMFALAEEAQCDLLVFSYDMTKDFSVPGITRQMRDATVGGDEMRKSFQDYMDFPTCAAGAPWNKLYRRDVILENELRFPPLRRHQDEGFSMRYAAVLRSVRFSSEILYHHFLNNQERRWRKYPLRYDESVEGLMDIYESLVIPWNPGNNAVRTLVYRIYYRRNLDFLKVLFNPKWKFSHIARYRRLVARQKVFEARCKHYAGLTIPHDNYWKFIQGGHYLSLYCSLYYSVVRDRYKGA